MIDLLIIMFRHIFSMIYISSPTSSCELFLSCPKKQVSISDYHHLSPSKIKKSLLSKTSVMGTSFDINPKLYKIDILFLLEFFGVTLRWEFQDPIHGAFATKKRPIFFWPIFWIPSSKFNIAMENHHRNSGFTH